MFLSYLGIVICLDYLLFSCLWKSIEEKLLFIWQHALNNRMQVSEHALALKELQIPL
jgi:hypothetical protein